MQVTSDLQTFKEQNTYTIVLQRHHALYERGCIQKKNSFAQVNGLLNFLQVNTRYILGNKIKHHVGGIRILEMSRWDMAQNRLGTTSLTFESRPHLFLRLPAPPLFETSGCRIPYACKSHQ